MSVVRHPMTETDMGLADWLGKARQARNEQACIREARRDGNSMTVRDACLLHVLGATAEIAFARLYGLTPDLTTTPRANAVDFIINGWRIDVKAADRNSWRGKYGGLNCSTKKSARDVDIYVQAVVDFECATVDFIGWARSQDLINPCSVKLLRGTETYVIERCDLWAISALEQGIGLRRRVLCPIETW